MIATKVKIDKEEPHKWNEEDAVILGYKIQS